MERKRAGLLDDLERVDPVLLTRRVQPATWSIREIVEHLVVAERDVLRGLPDPRALGERDRSARNRLAHRVVLFVLRAGIPVRAPSRAMLPTGEAPLPLLRERWEESHRWLRAYLESLDAEGLDRAVFAHPVSGPITVRQAVDLMGVHLDRHLGQIRKVREALERSAGR